MTKSSVAHILYKQNMRQDTQEKRCGTQAQELVA